MFFHLIFHLNQLLFSPYPPVGTPSSGDGPFATHMCTLAHAIAMQWCSGDGPNATLIVNHQAKSVYHYIDYEHPGLYYMPWERMPWGRSLCHAHVYFGSHATETTPREPRHRASPRATRHMPKGPSPWHEINIQW